MSENVVKINEPIDILGPERRGHSVIVDGRVVPFLHAHDGGDSWRLVLDGRFRASFPKDRHDLLWFLANAMAVAAGYPCLEAEAKHRPFAPRSIGLDSPNPPEPNQ